MKEPQAPQVSALKHRREGFSGRGVATRRRMKPKAVKNTAHKLKRREAEGDRPISSRAFASEHFRRLRIQEAFDPIHLGVHNLTLRVDIAARIVRIQMIDSLIFVIAASGLCVVFDRVTNTRLGVLNQERNEKVSILHFNDLDCSVISVTENATSGKCYRIPLELMKKGNFQHRVHVFGVLNVDPFLRCHSGLAVVENKKQIFDIFDLRDYSLRYSIADLDYVEYVLPLPDMILILRQVVRDETALIIRNIQDGMDIKEFLLPSDKVTQICLVKEKLLYTDQNGVTILLDMSSSKVKSLKPDKLKKAKVRCLRNNLLFSWEEGRYSVWELDTRKVTNELKLLWQGRYIGRNSVLVVHDDSMVLSYYRPKDGSERGSITVTHTWTGQLVAKITDDIYEPNNSLQTLDSLSAMYYNEEKQELYTGTLDGGFQIWCS